MSILTAHATSGMQWHTVVVAGVQEDSWPLLNETGTLFGQEELVDLLDDNIEPGTPLSRLAERLAEEKRLFELACTRAQTELLITTVNAPDADEVLEPSRFLRPYLTSLTTAGDGGDQDAESNDPAGDLLELLDSYNASIELAQATDILPLTRLLSVPAIVAELRRALMADSTTEKIKKQAARQLARLAKAGVPGADPSQWWGINGRSEHTTLPVYRLDVGFEGVAGVGEGGVLVVADVVFGFVPDMFDGVVVGRVRGKVDEVDVLEGVSFTKV